MSENLSLAANCAASILMFAAFCGFVTATVVLYSAVRALRATRRALPDHIVAARTHIEKAVSITLHSTDEVVRPHIAVASTWAGVRAGMMSLIGSRRTARSKPVDLPPDRD